MRRRSPRLGRSPGTYASLCAITHSKATARGSALGSSLLIQKAARRALEQACRSTGSTRGKLAETWLMFQEPGSAWPDAVAQEHWTSPPPVK